MDKKVSIILSTYNEATVIEETITQILKNLDSVEIILVDDCSTDGTVSLIKNKLYKKVHKVIYHENNQGKGAAIRSAQKMITGDIVIIQDADLEYNPEDYFFLVAPILSKKFDVVYGSRVLGKSRYRSKNFTSKFRIFDDYVVII